jgi:hypothetical protein
MGPLKAESKVDSRKKSPLGAQRKSPWVMENQRKLTDMVTLQLGLNRRAGMED